MEEENSILERRERNYCSYDTGENSGKLGEGNRERKKKKTSTSEQDTGLCTGLGTEKREGKRTERIPSLRPRIQSLPKTET